MCGICGEVSFGAGVSTPALEAMTVRLPHRGPDHGATLVSPDGSAGLGFRRLSIIDLRAAANQPIGNEDGSVQLVFNGEIYNYKDLRPGLIGRGHQFRSNADSEVIVHLYEEHGVDCVQHLRGMFAFAIWDDRRGRLFMARDRLGQKPLFYRHEADRLLFASELKAMARYPKMRLRECTVIVSEMMPIAGRIMMYTTGWL